MKKPSALNFFFSGIVLFTGIISISVLCIMAIVSTISLYSRLITPGSAQLDLTDTGKYIVFYEYKSTIDNKEYKTEYLPAGNLELLDSNNNSISISEPEIEYTYNFPDKSGTSIAEFKITKPGKYTLTTRYTESKAPKYIISILNETKFYRNIAMYIILIIFISLLTYAISVTWTLITIGRIIKYNKYTKMIK